MYSMYKVETVQLWAGDPKAEYPSGHNVHKQARRRILPEVGDEEVRLKFVMYGRGTGCIISRRWRLRHLMYTLSISLIEYGSTWRARVSVAPCSRLQYRSFLPTGLPSFVDPCCFFSGRPLGSATVFGPANQRDENFWCQPLLK